MCDDECCCCSTVILGPIFGVFALIGLLCMTAGYVNNMNMNNAMVAAVCQTMSYQIQPDSCYRGCCSTDSNGKCIGCYYTCYSGYVTASIQNITTGSTIKVYTNDLYNNVNAYLSVTYPTGKLFSCYYTYNTKRASSGVRKENLKTNRMGKRIEKIVQSIQHGVRLGLSKIQEIKHGIIDVKNQNQKRSVTIFLGLNDVQGPYIAGLVFLGLAAAVGLVWLIIAFPFLIECFCGCCGNMCEACSDPCRRCKQRTKLAQQRRDEQKIVDAKNEAERQNKLNQELQDIEASVVQPPSHENLHQFSQNPNYHPHRSEQTVFDEYAPPIVVEQPLASAPPLSDSTKIVN